MSDIEIFLESAKILQSINSNRIFSLYKNSYKSLFEKAFKKSSVTISFRIRLTDDFLSKFVNSNQEEFKIIKKKFNEDLQTFLKEEKNYLKSDSVHIENNKILSIKSLKNFLKTTSNAYKSSDNNQEINIFQVDILFIKRAPSKKDRYSGHIAFPGGKFEKSDANDFNTAIRETKEEIGLSLNSDLPVASRYFGANYNYEVTIDFRYVVISHLFVIFDFFNECEKNFVLSDGEISDVFFVPLNYFLNFNIENRKDFIKMISQKLFGHKVNIGKLILNNDENYLLYGLTLRKILNFFNFTGNNIKHSDFFEFVDDSSLNFVRKFAFSLFFYFFRFVTNPFQSFRLIRDVLFTLIFYYTIVYISRYFLNGLNVKF